MTKDDRSFDEWFELLQLNLSDLGVKFEDVDAVRGDYEDGKSMYDVLDDIKAEYAD